MGVTLLHPHGQIYAYGFVPQLQARAAQLLQAHLERTGRDLVVDLALAERERQIRVVAAQGGVVAFAPRSDASPTRPGSRRYGRCPISPARHGVRAVAGLAAAGRAMARSMPYLMTVNQAPTNEPLRSGWTVRIEIWPIRRAANKLKFLAGTELGAGVFANDITPEKAAADLRAVRL